MTLKIRYESESFPANAPIVNGVETLTTTWDDLLWAAITVGRPNRQYVFRHGIASSYEALFRLSLIRMALEENGIRTKRLQRTSAARTLDPSEKGAVNYFLGLAIYKLFAAQLLNVPWMLHLDVFRPLLNPVLTGRSRPDLIGEMVGGGWVALECKGRLSSPDTATKSKAKAQAQRLVSINGTAPVLHIGGIAYFKNEFLQFFWIDPESNPNVSNPISVEVPPDVWRHYYTPILNLIHSDPEISQRMRHDPILLPVSQADIEIGIHPLVLDALEHSHWQDARLFAQFTKGLIEPLRYRDDGIAIIAGESWKRRFTEADQEER